MVLASSSEMANATLSERRRPMNWRGILIAAGLTVAFSIGAGLIASLIQAPALMLMLAALAFFGVGFATLRLRPGANPLEPAIGASVTVLVFSLLQLAVAPSPAAGLPAGQVILSMVIAVFFAFSLTWLGARTSMSRMTPRREAP